MKAPGHWGKILQFCAKQFFQVILSLTLLWCYALFPYQSTSVVLTLEDWVNFYLHLSTHHFAWLQYRFSVPQVLQRYLHWCYQRGKFRTRLQASACLSLSKAGSCGEPWTHWTAWDLQAHTQSDGKEWKEMLQSVIKKRWQVSADVKNSCISP